MADDKIIGSLSGITASEWNNLVEAGNPFMRYEFLRALEDTACTGQQTGWIPCHAIARNATGMTGALAAYLRSDSYGEYIFDWAWANAYEQAGLAYYPKITVAAPFTPATGNRILRTAREGNSLNETGPKLITDLEDFAVKAGASGIHFLCLTREEQKFLSDVGYLPRITHQYHWLNRNFSNFDDYLDGLRAHRRKEIRRERRKVDELGLRIELLTGSQIREQHMRAMFAFYLQTYSRKWGSPYLNMACFLELWKTMADSIVLILASDRDEIVAGSIAFRAHDRLFGRYWGASAHYPYLHFELCFYRLIEYAITEKISIFEAGAQGEHKFQRGFTAMPVFSSHKLFHPQGAGAIAQFLSRERRATLRALRAYRKASPNKQEAAYIPELDDL